MKSTNKDMTDSLNFWGVGKIYTYGKAVAAANWKSVSEEKKKIIKQEVHKLANKIKKQLPKKETSLKTKALFLLFRALQKRKPFSKADEKYWTEKGWLGSKRPWKK